MRAKSSIRWFQMGCFSSSRPRVTTLALSYRQRRGTPPRYSKALTWHRMKAAVSPSGPAPRSRPSTSPGSSRTPRRGACGRPGPGRPGWPSRPGPARRGLSRNAWWRRAAGVAAWAIRRTSGWNSPRRIPGLSAPGAAPRSFPAPHRGDGPRIPCRDPPELVEGFEARCSRGLGRMASGDFRYRRTVFRAMPKSSAIPRMERPAPFIPKISFTCPTFNKTWRAPPRRLRE